MISFQVSIASLWECQCVSSVDDSVLFLKLKLNVECILVSVNMCMNLVKLHFVFLCIWFENIMLTCKCTNVWMILAATKQLYEWFSPSVCVFVRLSEVKGQGHRGVLNPVWAYRNCTSNLISQMATKECTNLKIAYRMCSTVFQGHLSNLKLKWGDYLWFAPIWAFADDDSNFN